MIRAEQQGRRLVLTVEQGEDEPQIAPFVLSPLPMEAGRQLTAEYVAMVVPGGIKGVPTMTEQRKVDIFRICMDGVDDPEVCEPRAAGTPIYDRVGRELSQSEGEEILVKAMMWHTIVGIDGIRTFDDAGGGVAGTLKAIRLLLSRMGLLPSPTSNSSASESLTQQAAIPGTSTPDGGRSSVPSLLDRLPANRRSIRQHRAG